MDILKRELVENFEEYHTHVDISKTGTLLQKEYIYLSVLKSFGIFPCMSKFALNLTSWFIFIHPLRSESHTFSAPGKPTNITYQILDCSVKMEFCNLNISWRHPYYQNGTITAFNIQLNETDSSDGIEKHFSSITKVVGQNYSPKYSCQVSEYIGW